MNFLKRILNVKNKTVSHPLVNEKPITTQKHTANIPIRAIKTCNQCHKVCIVENEELNCPMCGAKEGLKHLK